MTRLIPPRYVVERYLGIEANNWDDRRTAYQLYQNTNINELLRMALEMGYTGLDVAINAYLLWNGKDCVARESEFQELSTNIFSTFWL